jgi:hypothetical protein
MRIVLILAALAIVARVIDQKLLGLLILLFILGCSLWGVGETVVDLMTGNSTLTKEGRRRHLLRHLESLPSNFNPCYHNLRRRGISHAECLRRGEPPLRPDDYYEKKIERMQKEYPGA